MMLEHDCCLGVDLGGTKIECAVLRGDGSMAWRRRLPTPQGDYDATLQVIATLVRQAETELGLPPMPVGLAIPGSISPRNGRIRNANSTVLNGRPLQQDLEGLLQRPLRLSNDANCLAVSEATDGAAAGAEMTFAVILGTGSGSGLAFRGQLWGGRNGVAGEWAHNPLPWARPQPAWGEAPGPLCWCGQHNCLETWISGPGFERDHAASGGAAGSAPQIVAAMRAGDPKATASFTRLCDRLARGLAQVINLLDPEVIVLGGGISRIDEIYREVPQRWRPWIFSDIVATRLLPALHGDSSGVRGAAWLWRQPPR